MLRMTIMQLLTHAEADDGGGDVDGVSDAAGACLVLALAPAMVLVLALLMALLPAPGWPKERTAGCLLV